MPIADRPQRSDHFAGQIVIAHALTTMSSTRAVKVTCCKSVSNFCEASTSCAAAVR